MKWTGDDPLPTNTCSDWCTIYGKGFLTSNSCGGQLRFLPLLNRSCQYVLMKYFCLWIFCLFVCFTHFMRAHCVVIICCSHVLIIPLPSFHPILRRMTSTTSPGPFCWTLNPGSSMGFSTLPTPSSTTRRTSTCLSMEEGLEITGPAGTHRYEGGF